MSWLSGSEQDNPWFRIRSYGVGTSELVAGLSLVMMVVYAISPTLASYLVLSPGGVLHGYVWQVVTWPFIDSPSIWTIWNAVVFWFTGKQLEREIGKSRFGWMLLGITVAGSLLAVLLGLVFSVNLPVLAGLSTISMIVVLIFIAQNPRMPVFFGIPAWVLGLVIVILPLLSYVGARYWVGLLHFVLTLVAAAIVAKLTGLLSGFEFIPGHSVNGGQRKRRRKAGSRKNTGGSNVVQGPWVGAEPPARGDDEMDALLDKIMANGLDSLTTKERKRLEELRQQRRGR